MTTTLSDHELLRSFALHLTCMTEWALNVSFGIGRSRLSRLVQQGHLARFQLQGAKIFPAEPVTRLVVNGDPPDAERLSRLARTRHQRTETQPLPAYRASGRTFGRYGVVRRPKLRALQTVHACGVTADYLYLRQRYPNVTAQCYRAEHMFSTLSRPGQCVVDAMLVHPRTMCPQILLERLGHYEAERIRRLIRHARKVRLPLWMF